MKIQKRFMLLILLLTAAPASFAAGEKLPQFSVRAHVGTDVTLGVARGVGARFYFNGADGTVYEFGPDLFYAKSEETTQEFNTYYETTELTIFAARINVLRGFSPKSDGLYYVFGTGAAAGNVSYTETSPNDVSLGTPLPTGGSMQSEEATAFAALLNFGVGKRIGEELDLRFEMPTLIFFSTASQATKFAPALTLGLGYSF